MPEGYKANSLTCILQVHSDSQLSGIGARKYYIFFVEHDAGWQIFFLGHAGLDPTSSLSISAPSVARKADQLSEFKWESSRWPQTGPPN